MVHQKLKTKPIKPLMWELAVPAITGMIVNALYNLVDGIFVGLATGEKGIAAISIAMPVMLITFAIGLMFAIGGSSVYSRAIGAENLEQARVVSQSTMVHMMVIAVLYTALGLLFAEPIARLFGMQNDFYTETMNYFNIIFYGTPFLYMSIYFNNFFRAEGQSKIAMIGMVSGTLVNIILDPILIFGFSMGTLGAAIATVIGYFVSAGYLLYKQYGSTYMFRLQKAYLKWNQKIFQETTSIGFATFVRNTTGSIVVIVVNNLLVLHAEQTTVALAVFGIYMRIQMFFLMPAFGINQSMMPIVGFNFGARRIDRVKQARNYALKMMYVYLVLFYILYFLFAKNVLQLFGVEQATLEYGVYYTRIGFVGLMFIAIQILLTGYFQAMGRPKFAIFLALLRQVLLFIPLAVLFGNLFGEFGVWISLPISDILSSFVGWFILRHENKHLKTSYGI